MRKLILTAAVAFTALAGTAANAAASGADRDFLIQDVQGARYELALAKLAATKATKPQVRSYAQKIIHDHERANSVLMRLVRQEGVTPPTGMTGANRATLDQLKSISGAGFDKDYVDEVTRINAEDEQSSKKEAAQTQDRRIKAYLQRFSSMDAMHKKMGEQLKAAVS